MDGQSLEENEDEVYVISSWLHFDKEQTATARKSTTNFIMTALGARCVHGGTVRSRPGTADLIKRQRFGSSDEHSTLIVKSTTRQKPDQRPTKATKLSNITNYSDGIMAAGYHCHTVYATVKDSRGHGGQLIPPRKNNSGKIYSPLDLGGTPKGVLLWSLSGRQAIFCLPVAEPPAAN